MLDLYEILNLQGKKPKGNFHKNNLAFLISVQIQGVQNIVMQNPLPTLGMLI